MSNWWEEKHWFPAWTPGKAKIIGRSLVFGGDFVLFNDRIELHFEICPACQAWMREIEQREKEKKQ